MRPIPIPRTEVKLKDKAKCRVAGWGFTKTGGKISNGLKVADVSLMSLKECKNKWKFLKHSLPNNITCAAGPKLKAGFCKVFLLFLLPFTSHCVYIAKFADER